MTDVVVIKKSLYFGSYLDLKTAKEHMAKDKRKFNQIIHQMLISDIQAETVNLSGSNLNINDIELLCHAIEHGRITKKIILSCNSIDDRKIALITGALSKNVGFRELVLSDNNINNQGVIAIKRGGVPTL